MESYAARVLVIIKNKFIEMACFYGMKLNLRIKLKLKFKDKMFQNPKNLSHQQALSHIQSLFPSVALPSFAPNTTLKSILDVTY